MAEAVLVTGAFGLVGSATVRARGGQLRGLLLPRTHRGHPGRAVRSVIDVCLNGAFIVARYAGRHLTDGGALVSISSLNARQPALGMAAYCAAKAGLSMLTEVAALIPGVVEDYLENTALGRAGVPEDIAEAVLFLVKASWLTGEVLDINGGAHLKRYPDVIGHITKLAAQP